MRICSLVPAATEVLFALGRGDSVVGVTHECDYPPEAAERRAELEPDAVIVQEMCRVCAVTTDELDEVVAAQDVEAEIVPYSPSTLDEILASIVGLGVRFDAESQADDLTGGMRAR